jgi:hypothetical protein
MAHDCGLPRSAKGEVMKRLLGGTLVGLSSTLIMEYAGGFL